MRAELIELYKFRELLYTLVVRELRVRYKNSFLGFFWSLLNPLVTVMVMTLIFKHVMGMKIANYSAYVLAAYLPWTFFQFALLDSSQTVLAYMPVIKKIYFPRELLPISAIIANFIHFLLAMGVFLVYLHIFVGAPVQATMLFVPLLMIAQLLLTLGLSFFIASLNVFYEDIKYLVSIGVQLLFFLSPVIYFSEQIRHASLVPEAYRQTAFYLYHGLNPVATILTLYRKLMLPPITVEQSNWGVTRALTEEPLPAWLLCANGLTAILIALAGYAYFNRKKWLFVERP